MSTLYDAAAIARASTPLFDLAVILHAPPIDLDVLRAAVALSGWEPAVENARLQRVYVHEPVCGVLVRYVTNEPPKPDTLLVMIGGEVFGITGRPAIAAERAAGRITDFDRVLDILLPLGEVRTAHGRVASQTKTLQAILRTPA